MMIFQTNKSKFIVMMAFVLMGFFSITLFAQEKEESKSKLDQLKGKVEKITVKVDGKDVVFEGKEAQKIADQLRDQRRIKVFAHNEREPGERGEGNVMFFRSREKNDDNDDNDEINDKDVKKKVEIKSEDGNKIITVTTTKDGKEETKTYEGEDAEKFLKDEKGMKHISVTLNDDENMPHDKMIYFNKQMGKGMGMRSGCCCGGECKGMAEMKHMSMPGRGMKKMIIKEYDDNDKESGEKEVEKKIEKK